MRSNAQLWALKQRAKTTETAIARELGVHQSTVSRMLNGISRSTPDRLALLLHIISRNAAATTDPVALESDRKRTVLELFRELSAIKDVLRSVAYELDAGGDPVSLNKIGQGALLRVEQIAAALLDRSTRGEAH